MIRAMVSAAFFGVACNGLLDNEERHFVENTSESGGMESTTHGGGAVSGEAGLGGVSSESGGAAGAGDAGEGGERSGSDGGGGSTGEPCECAPGHSEPAQVACGNCGTATVERLCGEDCRWGEYGAPSACMNEGVCEPNKLLEVTGHCKKGGWRFDTSTCGEDCQPGPWTRGECAYGDNSCMGCACMSLCTPATCKWISCDEASARAECVVDADDVCGTATFEFVEWLPD